MMSATTMNFGNKYIYLLTLSIRRTNFGLFFERFVRGYSKAPSLSFTNQAQNIL